MKISASTFEFLEELKQNNNRPWFEANKKRYLEARSEFVVFLTEFILKAGKIDHLPVQDPAKCIFRIYRDVRFSHNKDPYKVNLAAVVNRGPEQKKCMMYINLQPGESYVGGGMYEPTPEGLKAIRQEIHYNGEQLEKIVSAKGFKTMFGGIYEEGKLKKAPKGYDPAHPHIELLKFRHYVIGRDCPDDVVLSDNFMEYCLDTLKASLPFYSFIDGAILNSESV